MLADGSSEWKKKQKTKRRPMPAKTGTWSSESERHVGIQKAQREGPGFNAISRMVDASTRPDGVVV